MYAYLWINITLLILSIALSFIKKVRFYKDILYVLPAIIIPAVLFVTWDTFFYTWGIWSFNDKYITGIYWFGIPMEEVLFYISVPYMSLMIYSFVKILIQKDIFRGVQKLITALILLLTLVLFFAFRKQMYTSIVSLICAFLLTIRTWIARPKSMGYFYLSFLICLIPIFVINIILCNLPIITYNSKYILTFKLYKFPVENLLLFLALFLMNVGIYDYFKRRNVPVRELKNEGVKE